MGNPNTAYITGASRGIGRAIALELGREGYDIAFSYQQATQMAESLQEELKALGRKAYALQGDVGDYEQCQALCRQAQEALGRIDALVCNAGVSHLGLLQDMSLAQWHKVMDTNLHSLFYTTQSLLPGMIQEKAGSIVILSSMWGQVGASCEVAYSAAKAAAIGFTKALAQEVAPSGIRVNCVAPGVIDTDMNAILSQEDLICLKEETPLGRLGSKKEVAQTVAFLLSQKASYFTGQILAPNGGLVM